MKNLNPYEQVVIRDMEVHERVIFPEEEAKIKVTLAMHYLFEDLSEDIM